MAPNHISRIHPQPPWSPLHQPVRVILEIWCRCTDYLQAKHKRLRTPAPEMAEDPTSCSSNSTLLTVDSESSEEPPRKKTKTRARTKCGDLSRSLRAIVLLAIRDYRSILATQAPFPNQADENTMAGASLARSCVTCSFVIQDQDNYDDAIQLVTFLLSYLLTMFGLIMISAYCAWFPDARRSQEQGCPLGNNNIWF